MLRQAGRARAAQRAGSSAPRSDRPVGRTPASRARNIPASAAQVGGALGLVLQVDQKPCFLASESRLDEQISHPLSPVEGVALFVDKLDGTEVDKSRCIRQKGFEETTQNGRGFEQHLEPHIVIHSDPPTRL